MSQRNARGLEVRLLRRLPAVAARLRGRAARARRRARASPTSSRRSSATSRAPTTCRSSRARSPPPRTPSASARSARRSRRLVAIGACATAGGIQALRNFADVDDFVVDRLRQPAVHLDAGDLDARSPRTSRSTSSSGLPARQAPAARGHQRLPERAPARRSPPTACASSASARGNVCVMVAHGTPCLGPGHARRLRGAVPGYHRGCYGCFGPMEAPNAARSARWLAQPRPAPSATSCACTAPSTPARRRSAPRASAP